MPRTKVTKNAAAKRPRNQLVEEAHIIKIREIQQKADAYLLEVTLVHEQNIDKTNNTIQNLRAKLNPTILRMTMGELLNKKLTGNNDTTSNCNAADMTTVSNLTMGGCFTQMSGLSSKNRSNDEGKP